MIEYNLLKVTIGGNKFSCYNYSDNTCQKFAGGISDHP